MDSKKFFQEIRKIIREEIALALDGREASKPNSQEKFQTEIKRAIEMQEQVKKAPSNPNPTLQDLLMETRDEMLNGRPFSSGDAQGFDKKAMASMLGYGELPSHGSSPIPPTDINGKPVTQLDTATEKALTRNYSDIMKALKDKKKI